MSASEVIDVATGEIIPYEPAAPFSLFGTVDPDRAIAEGGRYAQALARVIDQQGMFAKIGSNKHITVEGWQTLGAMTGVYAVGEGEPEPVEVAGVAGFKATVIATRNGETIGRATAYCMRDEQRWKDQPTYAIASMAQTRATSKALKGPLGFIVKLAGYSATPAEEMPSIIASSSREATVSEPQIKNILRLIKKLGEAGISGDSIATAMESEYGTGDVTELTKSQASDFITRLKAKAGEDE